MRKGSCTQGMPYDFMSVMHYAETGFSVNGRPTIVPRRSAAIPPGVMGTSQCPSKYDYDHINLLYCNGKKW